MSVLSTNGHSPRGDPDRSQVAITQPWLSVLRSPRAGVGGLWPTSWMPVSVNQILPEHRQGKSMYLLFMSASVLKVGTCDRDCDAEAHKV